MLIQCMPYHTHRSCAFAYPSVLDEYTLFILHQGYSQAPIWFDLAFFPSQP